MFTYINSVGRPVAVTPTTHAINRFFQRHGRLYPDIRFPDDTALTTTMEAMFNTSTCMNPAGRHYKRRLDRYGKDTLYFINAPFVFVVQNACLLTVELGTADTRRLNKRNSTPPLVNPGAEPRTRGANPWKWKSKTPPPTKPALFRMRMQGYDRRGELKLLLMGSWKAPSGTTVDMLRGNSLFLQVAMERFKKSMSGWVLKTIIVCPEQEGEFEMVYDSGL